MADDLTRNISVILQLAQELRTLAEELSQGMAPVERLLITMHTAAEFLEQAHKFIVSVPSVVERAKLVALFDGYRSAADMLRGMAADLNERSTVIRPQTVLMAAAKQLEAAIEENRRLLHGEPEPQPKKLILN